MVSVGLNMKFSLRVRYFFWLDDFHFNDVYRILMEPKLIQQTETILQFNLRGE